MDIPEYQWRRLFWDALTDIGSVNSSLRLEAADDALFNRLLELEATTGTEAERLALEDTMQDLRLMRGSGYNLRFQNESKRPLA